MGKSIKRIVSLLVTIFMVFSLKSVGATPPEWYVRQVQERCDLYRKRMDKDRKPQTLIIGSGRGVLCFGDEVCAKEYDKYAYGDRKYDYFLVDGCAKLKPDYICDATNQESMDVLGPGTWDKCFLEFLPHRVNMGGALKNAFRLVRPGGKVYMNAENFFNEGYDLSEDFLPKRFRVFRNYFADLTGMHRQSVRPNFYVELGKIPLPERIHAFRFLYGLGNDIADIKLIPKSTEVWPAKSSDIPDLSIWEITKAKYL